MKYGYLFLLLAVICFAQSGRFAETKRLAFVNLEGGNYDRASALFEEVWENEPPDPIIAESLALAYLNGNERRRQPKLVQKAASLLGEALDLGGQATFLVHQSREKLTWLQGRRFNDYCSGLLSLRQDRLIYLPQQCYTHSSDPFDVSFDQIKEMSLEGKGEQGAFRIVLKTGSKYVMVPRTRLREDTLLLFRLAATYMSVK
jgi:hypothetical protein